MRLLTLQMAVIAILCGGMVADAAELRGEVVKIADGDTLTLLTAEKQQVRVRLAELDTSERGQSYGKVAKQLLAGLIFREVVRVGVIDAD